MSSSHADGGDARRWYAHAPIALQPLGLVQPRRLCLAARVIERLFSTPTVRLDPLPLDPGARTARGQWDADILLEELHSRLPERCLRVVGVAEVDLAITGRTFVFGYAHLTDGMALYSTARLDETWYGRTRDEALVAKRVLRTLAHELGHTFGVPHCEEPRCLMRAVSFVENLDALPVRFCPGCRARVTVGLGEPPWSSRSRWDRGMAWLRRREWERARRLFETAVAATPDDPRYHQSLAMAHAGRGDEQAATQALRRASELSRRGAASSVSARLGEGSQDDPSSHLL
jgi:archaemetzincin